MACFKMGFSGVAHREAREGGSGFMEGSRWMFCLVSWLSSKKYDMNAFRGWLCKSEPTMSLLAMKVAQTYHAVLLFWTIV